MYTGNNSEIKNETVTSDVVLETRAVYLFNRIRSSGVLSYFLTFVFLVVFVYIFFTEIDLPSLKTLLILSFVPALLVTMLLYFLFKRQFLIFLSFLIFLMPIFTTFFFLNLFDFSSKQSGYVLLTNKFNDRCSVKVMDYSKDEIPWYTKNGCVFNEENKQVISLYVKSGGSAMRWHNSCQDLRFTVSDFKKEHDRLKSKNALFAFGASEKFLSSEEVAFINKVKLFQTESFKSAHGFKNDISNITFEDILDVCELKNFNLGEYRVF